MPKKGEEHQSAQFRVELDEENGQPFWAGGGVDDKEECAYGANEPLTLDPTHFPPGTRIVVIEPWDEEFYGKLFDERLLRLGIKRK